MLVTLKKSTLQVTGVTEECNKARDTPTFHISHQHFVLLPNIDGNNHSTPDYTLPPFNHTNFKTTLHHLLRVIGRAKYLLIMAKQETNDVKCNVDQSVTALLD